MKHNIRHIVLLSVVLALIGVLVISSAAFAAGGSQAHAGAYSQNGNTYGPGDGTGPIGDGQFGPGPNGNCIDLNQNGICDCQEG
jgi:hypothetical protein